MHWLYSLLFCLALRVAASAVHLRDFAQRRKMALVASQYTSDRLIRSAPGFRRASCRPTHRAALESAQEPLVTA